MVPGAAYVKSTGRYFRWLLIACLLLPASPFAATQAPPLQVLVADVWPWSYRNDEDQLQGLLVDLFRELEAMTGQSMELRLLPHQRVLLELEQGLGDVSILFANPAVDNFAERSTHVLQSRFFLMAPQARKDELSLDGLAGESVGFIRGTFYGAAFEANRSIIKVPVSSLEQGVMMLKAGRLHAMISSEQLVYHTLKDLALSREDWRLELHSEKQMAYLYRHRQNVPASRVEPLVVAIEQLRANGELQYLVGVPPLDQSPAVYSPADRQSSLVPPLPEPD
ncbi:MAG: hypothetical protein EA348_03035 [Pseudomonadaceae bacterium]|nr:MAG: hypothetical protein EA348_03035 [Pseudomonadaceae bacterium]